MFKKILIALAALAVLIQLVPQSVFPTTNPPVNPANTVESRAQALSPAVSAILERSCYDCHSNRTVWPWYSKVAPVAWLVSNDVTEARREVNFSDWAQYNPKRAAHKLKEICAQVDQGDMPLWYYRPMHPNSKLSPADKSAVCAWTRAESALIK
ncbi:MAG TPA: heme-binding domain-containing protein [Bryobacteraceae bacterium]|nr:heme-binding domain-containing protein [Bryobacteraceae bacterium]